MNAPHRSSNSTDEEASWRPALHETVWDAAAKKVGEVMEASGPNYYLRPLGGGLEWVAVHIRPATQSELLSARVAAENKRARRGGL